MFTKKGFAYTFVGAMVLTFIVAITPPAAAQGENKLQVKQDVAPKYLNAGDLNGGRLPPETAELRVEYSFKVTAPAATVCPLQPVTLTFTADKKADWASQAQAVMSVNQVGFFLDQSGSSAPKDYGPFTTVLSIKVTRQVPAFQSGEYAVTAQALPGSGSSGGCNLGASNPLRVPITVNNDYIPIMEYTPAKYIQKSGQNKEVVFTVNVVNFGNGQTRVTTSVNPVSKNKLDTVVPPAPLTLDSRAELGEKAQYQKPVVISARTPHSNGYTNSLYTFSATFEAAAVQTGVDIQPDKPQTVIFSVQVQGVYVPGFEPTSAIAALGMGLLILGMARRKLA